MDIASGNLSYEWSYKVNQNSWEDLNDINSTILFEPDIYSWLSEVESQNIVQVKVKVTNMFGENDIDIKTIYVVKEIPISAKTTGLPNFRDSKGKVHYSDISEGIPNEIYSDDENSMNRMSTSSNSTIGNTRLSSKHFNNMNRLNQNVPSFGNTSDKNSLKEKIKNRINKGKNL